MTRAGSTSLERLYTQEVSGRITRKKASEVVDFALTAWSGLLSQGEAVSVRGLGRFMTRVRRARSGFNPRTGAPVEVPAKVTVLFRPSRELRAAVAATGTVHVPAAPAAFLAFWKERLFDLPSQRPDDELALVFQCLADALVRHETVRLGHWAILRAVERKEQWGYDFKMRKNVAVPARWVVRFAPGVRLKALVQAAMPSRVTSPPAMP